MHALHRLVERRPIRCQPPTGQADSAGFVGRFFFLLVGCFLPAQQAPE